MKVSRPNGCMRLVHLGAAFESARMFIGALHVIYLLRAGVTLSQVALLQAAFSLTVCICEWPTGVAADTWGHKRCVVCACLLVACFYPCCLLAPHIGALVFAEVVYGLGLCCISGALEAWIASVARAEYPGDAFKINTCSHMVREYGARFNILTGTCGALIVGQFGDRGFVFVYSVSMLCMLVLALLFAKEPCPQRDVSTGSTSWAPYVHGIVASLRSCTQHRIGRLYVVSCALIVVAYQPIYHLWQPLLLPDSNRLLSSAAGWQQSFGFLGGAFIAYNAAKVAAHWFARTRLLACPQGLVGSGAALVGATCMILIGREASQEAALPMLLLLALLHGALSVCDAIVEARFVTGAPAASLAGAMSASNAVARLCGVLALSGIASAVTARGLPRLFAVWAGVLVVTAAVLLLRTKDSVTRVVCRHVSGMNDA